MFDARLLFGAPPMGILVAGCILELARIWQVHFTCISNIHKHATYKSCIAKLSISMCR
jgi:hypothetical protein